MQRASVLFYWESRQIFVHGFFGQYDPAIISAGDQNAQRLHTFFQLVHGFSNMRLRHCHSSRIRLPQLN
jgi:hypothetical protein